MYALNSWICYSHVSNVGGNGDGSCERYVEFVSQNVTGNNFQTVFELKMSMII
jgi:hypothetical protein